MSVKEICARAAAAAKDAARLSNSQKNDILLKIAEHIRLSGEPLLKANESDITAAAEKKKPTPFIDRLRLTPARLDSICAALENITYLPDPIGEVGGGGILESGISFVKRRVPLGVIGVIFEARPNVAADAAALCIKSGNACVLRGGSDAAASVTAIVRLIRESIAACGANPDIVCHIEDTSRESSAELMNMRGLVDVLLPRGGAGLIKSVAENARVPVIETGAGVCHVYVDKFADIEMAVGITDNAKTQRPSVCNSIETVLVHAAVAEDFLTKLSEKWRDKFVKIYGEPDVAEYIHIDDEANDETFSTEWGDNTISVKIVADIDEALAHVSKYSTKHSECIVTINANNAEKWQREVDAAAVYVNASTRFTDGAEFGLGAEIGISTQKLHVRGPVGLRDLTTFKYLLTGNGQIRK